MTHRRRMRGNAIVWRWRNVMLALLAGGCQRSSSTTKHQLIISAAWARGRIGINIVTLYKRLSYEAVGVSGSVSNPLLVAALIQYKWHQRNIVSIAAQTS